MLKEVFTIYKITNLLNGKCYIGQTKRTLDKRWKDHVSHALKQSSRSKPYFALAISKHGPDVWKREIIEQVATRDEAHAREITWIELNNSTNRELGYNIGKGGAGGSSGAKKRSQEHNRRIGESLDRFWRTNDERAQEQRERLTDRNRTPEARKRSSDAQKRRWNDAAARSRMSQKMKGRVVSQETRQRLRDAQRANWQDPDYRASMVKKFRTRSCDKMTAHTQNKNK